MRKTLFIAGHPYWNDSVANRAIIEEFTRINPDAEVSNIAELYPGGNIDVEAEQKKLLAADTIILQFPIMWYSCPSVMHRWMEEVLTFGFAYGQGGDKLKGKLLIASFTSGSTADAYSRYGAQKMTIDDLMPPFAGISNLCEMRWGGYIYSGGMATAGITDEDYLATLRERAKAHAGRLIRLIAKVTII